MSFLRTIIIYLPEIQPEGTGQQDWYDQDKSNVFLKSNYHIFTIMISPDNLSYASFKTYLSAIMWSDQSGKIRVSTFS